MLNRSARFYRRLGFFVGYASLLIVVVALVALFPEQQQIMTGQQGPAPGQAAAAQQRGRQPAPPLTGGTDWLNTQKPLNLAALRGRIVLLDFWTLC